MNTLGLRGNAYWSIAGSGILQLSNVLLLIAISRLLGTETLGVYSFAIAFCSPIIAFSTLGLRNLQVIESSERFHNDDFRRVQLLSSSIAVSAILLLALLSGRRGEPLGAIVAVALSQAASSQLDVFFAYFQKVRRMDVVARCRVINSLITLPSCLAAAYITRSLVAVILVMLIVRLLMLLFFAKGRLDTLNSIEIARKANWARARQLALSSIPIAAMTGIVTLEISIPSLVLDYTDGAIVLGHFMVVTTICLPVSFVLSSILQAALPYLAGDRASRTRISRMLISCLGILSFSGFIVVLLFGTELLHLFLGDGYVPIEKQLILSLAVGFASLVATILSYSLLAKRAYTACLRLAFLSCTITLACSVIFIPLWSLSGAVLSPLAGRSLCIILGLVSLQRLKFAEDRLPSDLVGNESA